MVLVFLLVVMANMVILQLISVNHAQVHVLLAHPLLQLAPVVLHIILFLGLHVLLKLAQLTLVLLVPLRLLLVIQFIIYLEQAVALLLRHLVLFIFLIIPILTILFTLNAILYAQAVRVVQIIAQGAFKDMI